MINICNNPSCFGDGCNFHAIRVGKYTHRQNTTRGVMTDIYSTFDVVWGVQCERKAKGLGLGMPKKHIDIGQVAP